MEYGLTDLNTPTHEAHGFKTSQTKEILSCWIFGELYKARNDFLHGNTINGERLTVRPSQRSLFLYTGILYRLALTGFLDLSFKRPIIERHSKRSPPTSATEWITGNIRRIPRQRSQRSSTQRKITALVHGAS